VDAEDKHAPLTDEQLVEALGNNGYPIARRTVAKYRDVLGIPVARLRKTL
jgi:RNA polymerase sigma-54 factor